jgi:putative FmdB family regulatory protein
MPIYEYQCKKCGAVSEFLVYGSAAPESACTSCGDAGLEKILSAPNVHTTAASSACQSLGCQTGPQCGSSPCASGGCCPKSF